jgi:hypothetical protein
MARMRPEEIDPDAVLGEKVLFEKFKGLANTDNWIALHSLDIFGDIQYGQGEADFVLLVPGQGLLVIEVKSHESIIGKKGSWILGGEKKHKGPVKQAWNNVHAIRKHLLKRSIDIADVPFLACVWFTNSVDVDVDDSSEWQDWMLLYAWDLPKNTVGLINGVFEEGVEMLGSEKGLRFSSKKAPLDKLENIARALRPEVTISKTAEMRIADVKKWSEAAVEQQLDVIGIISGTNKPYLVPGIAGTGKTHVAIHEAKKAHQRGERVLFTCYNTLLAEYLEKQLSDFDLVEVKNLHKYMTDLVGHTDSKTGRSDWWTKELPELAAMKILDLNKSERFDTLIVDEAQDLGLAEYISVLDLSLENGIAKSSVLLFGDFEHQGMYFSGQKALENYKESISGLTVLNPLTKNCRNTKAIGQQIMDVMGSPMAYSGYLRKDQGHEVVFATVSKDELIPNVLFEQIQRLTKSYKAENIVILSSSKVALQNALGLKNIKRSEIGQPAAGKVQWGTAKSFKGLEAIAVILVEFESDKIATRESFYVAGTRALAEFVCIYPDALIQKVFQGGENGK